MMQGKRDFKNDIVLIVFRRSEFAESTGKSCCSVCVGLTVINASAAVTQATRTET